VTHESEILEHRSSFNVKVLNGLANSWHYRFGLACETTALHPDVVI
jgi:hypothetical protein